MESGASSKQQKHYQNVVNTPLITGPPDLLVIDLLNCPSLHILIGNYLKYDRLVKCILLAGVVNKLISEFAKNAFSNAQEGEIWVEAFLKKVMYFINNFL